MHQTIQDIYGDYGQLHEDSCELNYEGGSFDGCTCDVRTMIDEIVTKVLREIDSEFIQKSHMIVSGLHGDVFQIKKQDWNNIRKAIIEQLK